MDALVAAGVGFAVIGFLAACLAEAWVVQGGLPSLNGFDHTV